MLGPQLRHIACDLRFDDESSSEGIAEAILDEFKREIVRAEIAHDSDRQAAFRLVVKWMEAP